MNNDLISREALKKAYFNAINETSIGEVSIINLIDNAPTVVVDEEIERQREEIERQREELYQSSKELYYTARMLGVERPIDNWIPINERLPEYSGLYLISVDDVVTVANFTGTYFMHRGGGRVEVYAWQSLPKPYKKVGA